jgi:hypothetical protein
MLRRVTASAGAAVMVAALLITTQSARADEPRGVAALFTQQDAVQAFDITTGAGKQVGTVTGRISGTSSVNFQFTITGPPVGGALPISFHNTVILTDLDGDQIFFDNDGTGTFHVGLPGDPFKGVGGPLRGTYEVTGATGKFAADWKVGTTLDYEAIWTTPPDGGFGTAYAQIASRAKD